MSPAAWKNYRLDEIALIQGGGTPERSEPTFFNGGIPWVTPTDLAPIGQISKLGAVKESITDLGLERSSAKLIEPGSVLFSSRASVGKIAVTDRACATNQGVANFTPFIDKVDLWFLAFLLRRYTHEIIGLASKTTFLEVPRGKLKAFEVQLPSVDEQRRIVARIKECMERVEEIDRLRAEAIEEAKAMLPSLLNQTFVDLGEAYKKVEINEVALETRYGTSRKCTSTPNGTAILRIPNVAGGFVNFDDLKYCPLDSKERERIALQNGDLLFVRTNGSRDLVGRCAIYKAGDDGDDYGFASYLIRVRLDQEKMRPHFLAFYLNSTHGRSELDKRRRTSAGQFNINSENLRNIEVPFPSIAIQDQIIDVLRDRQAQISQLQCALIGAQETESHLRDSILRKAFAGEL
ncbi:MAG: restriction endonuclease subunit S [Magnetococcales bacterium]|nr:restriction endonuclease subunit S [Magnetococcales bacterium]